MKNFTPAIKFLRNRMLWITFLLSMACGAWAQGQMYGDTIFWENFGNGSTRSDLSGLGRLEGMYKYEGELNYVYAINPAKLTTYISNNSSKDYVTDVPTFHEMPLVTTEEPYSLKPSVDGPGWTSQYVEVDNWRDRIFSSVRNADTETLAAWDDTATAENTIPCAWVWRNGEWKFGFYYITYTSTRCTFPNDGHYAIVSNLDIFNCGGADVNWLPNNFRDHTGFLNDTLSPLIKTSARVTTGDNGRMLFINCAAVTGISSPVYKRQVNELCRDTWFEFSMWFSSVQNTTNNSQFRLEFWSADPGDEPTLGGLTSASEGLNIENANNARLLKVGTTTPLGVAADLQKWFQVKENFKLEGQDYVWVVVRNYGQGGSGNDIVLDDIVFKPWAPFNLDVEISATSLANACVDGLVTILSNFPPAALIPSYIDITEYAFYIEGLKNGTWTQVGSTYPLQTQNANIPLEVTLSLAEYSLYSDFRVSVASKPTGFGGRCVTFSKTPTPNIPVPGTPTVVMSGIDVCSDGTGTQQGSFIIKNPNQSNCEGWNIKAKMPDGTTQVLTPATKASCP